MKKKYLKSIHECQNNLGIEDEQHIIDKVFSDEMILENIYKLQMHLAEFLTQRDYFDSKAELTLQEISRLEQQLN